MTDITPVSRLEATFRTYRLFGALCFCDACDEGQSVTDCRQPFPHGAGCAETAAETHPWIVILTAIDWAMRKADPVPATASGGAST